MVWLWKFHSDFFGNRSFHSKWAFCKSMTANCKPNTAHCKLITAKIISQQTVKSLTIYSDYLVSYFAALNFSSIQHWLVNELSMIWLKCIWNSNFEWNSYVQRKNSRYIITNVNLFSDCTIFCIRNQIYT